MFHRSSPWKPWKPSGPSLAAHGYIASLAVSSCQRPVPLSDSKLYQLHATRRAQVCSTVTEYRMFGCTCRRRGLALCLSCIMHVPTALYILLCPGFHRGWPGRCRCWRINNVAHYIHHTYNMHTTYIQPDLRGAEGAYTCLRGTGRSIRGSPTRYSTRLFTLFSSHLTRPTKQSYIMKCRKRKEEGEQRK
jgi:hypothetical protein